MVDPPGAPHFPDNVRETISKRVSTLAADSRRILASASVLGRSFDVGVLTRMTRLEDSVVRGALADGVAAAVVASDGDDRYRFSHALVEDTLYEGLGAARQARLHKAAAEVLEQLAPADPPIAAIAHHLSRALPLVDRARAVDFAQRAAADAAANGAHEQAVEHYEGALEAARSDTSTSDCCLDAAAKARLLCDLGWACANSGMLPRAAEAFSNAADLARYCDALLFAEAALGIGGGVEETVGTNLSPSQAGLIEMLETARDALPADERYVRSMVVTRLAGARYDASEIEVAKELSTHAVEIARDSGDTWAIATALAMRHTVLSSPATLRERLALDDELRELGATRSLQAQVWRVGDLLECGQLAEADDAVVHIEADSLARLEPRARWYGALYRAMRAQVEGRLNEALELSEEARIVGEHVGARTAGMSDMVQSMFVAREQRRLDGLAELMDVMADEHPHQPGFLTTAAWCRVETGHLDEARVQLAQLAARGFVLPHTAYWLPNMRSLAEVAYGLGAADEAKQLYELLFPYRDHFVVTARVLCFWGSVEHSLGLLALTAGDLAAADDHLARARAAHIRVCSPLLIARTDLAGAALFERRGETGRAHSLRQQVGAVATANGWIDLAATATA
ncbi:MAG: hypothetical protein ACT4OX_15550 [Actinomycetota bacterium]